MAGSIVQVVRRTGENRNEVEMVEFLATADASNGTFPTLELNDFGVWGSYLALQTNPGATAPTDGYDITAIDADGYDRFNGVGLGRDTANTEREAISGSPFAARGETITLTIANNSVNSATIRIKVWFARNAVGAAGSGGGDATAANQDDQTTILSAIEDDTGTIATSATSLASTVGTEDSAPGANPFGLRVLATRDDALSTLTPAESDEVRLRVDGNGALWVQLAGALAASTDQVSIGASASGGYTPAKLLDIDETEDEIKATAGKVGGWAITNLHSATVYVKFFNATAANVTVGSTAPTITIAIPAATGIVMPLGGPGIAFGTAICIAATLDEADADATAIPSANLVVGTVFYV